MEASTARRLAHGVWFGTLAPWVALADLGRMASGTGLQRMADRLDAIGGDVRLRSAPRGGATVTGIVSAHGSAS